ncbi:unnamed protein product, partial [Ectocarpus fasciculatus]
RDGLIFLAWAANQLIVYTSNAGMRELFESGKFFKKPSELGSREVSKIERQLRKQEADAKDPPKRKNAQKGKKRKTGEKSKRGEKSEKSEKRAKRGKEADKSGGEQADVEEPGEEHRGGKQPPRVFGYVPARVKDNDYSPFITYVHDKIEEAAAEAKKRAGAAEEEEDVTPKILTFAKVKAGRARSIQGSNHEWPLDHLFLDVPSMHFESLTQAAGRAQRVDRRPLGQGPTMWASEKTQLRFTNAIIADQACREILRQGNTPLKVMRDLLKDAKSSPEGGELVVKLGVLEAVGPTGHSRKGTCLAYTGEHTEVTRTVKQKQLDVVIPPPPTEESKEEPEAGSVLFPTGDAMKKEKGGSLLLPPAGDAMEEEDEEEKDEEEKDKDGEGGPAGNEEMETASSGAGADAEGDPEPDAAYWVSNHLEDIIGTMAQALRER